MAMNSYLSVLTINVNGLNAPIKVPGYQNVKENNIHLYAVYKRHTLDLKTPSD